MVRNRKRKSETYGKADHGSMERAVKLVFDGHSIREISKDLQIPKSTLQRYVSNARKDGITNIRLTPNWDNARVFFDTEEAELEEYLLTAAKHCHGLTITATKELAYQYAMKNKQKYPESWNRNQKAGDDWFYGFMGWHGRLSVRKPEATSLSRATSFNTKNVGDFFDNLESVFTRYNFEPKSIYNCDETGLVTVHKPPSVVGEKKAKQVGQITSAERGVLVTMFGAINAQGNSIPPFLVFPRVNFKDYMLKNAPPGTMGAAHPSGWMTSANLVVWMDHFIKQTQCSKEKPVLLLMDNHESHISIESLDKAKNNGIVLLTFPPHCSHKLQPLDRTVYGPVKKYYNAACNSWMLANPGKPMSIYDVAGVLGDAFPRAFCPTNISSGFKVSGIFPYDRHVFTEDEFMSSFVTDRPEIAPITLSTLTEEIPQPQAEPEPDAGPSDIGAQTCQTTSHINESTHFSPEQVRPFPKAGARKQTKTGRKRGRTAILTDIPEKMERERELAARKRGRQSKSIKVTDKADSETSDSETDVETSDLLDDSDTSIDNLEVKSGDYVMVKYATKKVVRHYIGILLADPDAEETVEVKFLTRMLSKTSAVFCYPEKEDIAEVDLDNIVRKLPTPNVLGGTKRTSQQFAFDVDLSSYYRVY